MKLNFRIKDRVEQKHLRLSHPSPNQDKNFHNTNLSKGDELKLSSLLQSFEKIIGSLVISNQNKTTESPKNTHRISNRLNQVDFRDRFVIIDLPNFDGRKVDQDKLQTWLGELCSEILSVAFHYLTEKKMNYDQMRAFVSQSFLRNLVILADNANFTSKDMEFINTKMKEKIFPYLITKYPLTVEKEINKNLQALVKSIDNSQMVENDYLYSSGVVFEFRQNGRYDDLIMKLLNEIMNRCDGKSELGQDSVSNFKEFEKLMTKTFEKSLDLAWMNPEHSKPRKLFDIERIPQEQAQKQIKAQVQKYEKHKEHAKEYTSYLIGRKVSQNTRPYTDDEIQSNSLKIKSPAILRILTKWCEELWSKFENENYFWERKDGMSLNGRQSVCLIEESVKKKLTEQMKKEKEGLNKFNEKIKQINYAQQLKLLELELIRNESLFIQKYERVSGLFACKIVNNLQSFIVDYLNSLIHGLVRVSSVTQSQLDYYEELIIPVPLNLLSFTVSDILRCKYASKEKEVLKVFGEIQRMSQEHPDKFKIIRIKNRLQLSTNDILINAKFNNQINCQIQISVNTTHSDFMQCSNKVNHFIYELQRAQFGPALQMCSIWKTCEKRSNVFTKMIRKEKAKNNNSQSLIRQQNLKRKMVACRNPFVCSQCGLHFYHNNFFVSHQSDENGQYWKCAPCLISQNITAQNLQFFLGNHIKNKVKEIKSYKFCKDGKVPENGAFILVNKPSIQVNLFKKITYKGKNYLIALKDNHLSIIKTINSEQEREQFFKNSVVFSLSQQDIDEHLGSQNQKIEEHVISKIILPTYFKNCLKESRQTISILSQRHLSKVDLEKLITDNTQTLKNIKSIEFSESGLQNIELISPRFKNLTRLILNKNKIKDISRLSEFTKLERIDLSYNRIIQIPDKIDQLKNLKELIVRKNLVECLPQGIFELDSLKILDMTENKLQQLESLEKLSKRSVILQNLRQLNLRSNLLRKIPENLSLLSNLNELNLSNNQLTVIPEKLAGLSKLTLLDLSQNKLTTIPEELSGLTDLTQLNLSRNKLIKIPEKLSNLKNLTQLDLRQNQLIEIPQKLGSLTNLTHLYLSENQLATIPEELGCLTTLTNLYLGNNKLTAIPENLGNLSNLTYLYLNQNQLTTIPEKLGYLSNLNRLNLRQNQLETLPEKLGDLSNLIYLNLCRNKLTIIPQEFGNLSNLAQLVLSQNKLVTIPDYLMNLHKLQVLQLGRNNFEQIPEAISHMNYLKILKLQFNQIKQIPQSICCHPLIEKLGLKHNKIEKIPKEIDQMKSLVDEGLLLEGNPLKEVGNEAYVLKKFPLWKRIQVKLKKQTSYAQNQQKGEDC